MTTESTEPGSAPAEPGSVVVTERRGPIAVLRLNRPDRLNAFTIPMMEQLIAAFDETDADDSVRAVVLTGTGRAFCAGADLEAGASTFASPTDEVPPDGGGQVALRIHRSLKPVVSAVNGAAVGVGVTMTLPTDIRIASDDARFGFVFTKRGIVPEACSSWFLPRLVGLPTSLRWAMGGQTVGADEALERGLVQQVVAKDQVLDTAVDVATELITDTAPVSVALTRQLLWRMAGAPGPFDAHLADSRGIHHRGQSADVAEGVTSFLEKRPPRFTDRVSTDLPDIF
ncbi:enoyl-CoA hydratase-related protein [Gordonia soli]|uniref:Putative enoyl-CoA hydratase n=1 Tax=Gordonia soli NBRC 108243 TaxID=1223545 RepID=M0QPN8_9ACTN|nr:enoyl-CoA hydratase-related protein [Gordonia soli]GAC70538.1 putative enoyl-CoA hydratase [Gordonia soli NBRC 108243]